MNRKTLKTIQNIAAASIGRAEAKRLYNNREDFIRDNGAWISRSTGAIFVC
jgi:hypothetical protein